MTKHGVGLPEAGRKGTAVSALCEKGSGCGHGAGSPQSSTILSDTWAIHYTADSGSVDLVASEVCKSVELQGALDQAWGEGL